MKGDAILPQSQDVDNPLVQGAAMPGLLWRTQEGGPLGHGLRASMDGGSKVFSASPLTIPLLSPTGTDDEPLSPPLQEGLHEGTEVRVTGLVSCKVSWWR